MWPTTLNSSGSAPVLEPAAMVPGGGSALDVAQALGPVQRVAVSFVATLIISTVVLGLIQGYGTRTVTKCRRSPIISLCIGFPSAMVAGLVLWAGYLLSGTQVGIFFGVPIVAAGLTVIPAVTALGFVAIGHSIAARVGGGFPTAVVFGSLVAGLAAFALPVAVVGITIAAAFGMGASVRILLGGRGTAGPDERTVPPANQI